MKFENEEGLCVLGLPRTPTQSPSPKPQTLNPKRVSLAVVTDQTSRADIDFLAMREGKKKP